MGGGILYNRGEVPLTLEEVRLLNAVNMTLVDSFVVHDMRQPGGLESTYPYGFKHTDFTREQWDSRVQVAGELVPPGGSVEVGLKLKAADPKRVAKFENYELRYRGDGQNYVDTEPAGLIIGVEKCWR